MTIYFPRNSRPWPLPPWRSRKIREGCRSLWSLHPSPAPCHTLTHLPQPLLTCQSWERPHRDYHMACHTPALLLRLVSFSGLPPKALSLGGSMTHRKNHRLEPARASPLKSCGTLRTLSNIFEPQSAHLSNGDNKLPLRDCYEDYVINGSCYFTEHGF